MLRTIIWLLLAVIAIILTLPLFLLCLITYDRTPGAPASAVTEWMIKVFAPLFTKLAGLTIIKKGEENIPDGPALFVGNHQGDFDVALVINGFGRVPCIVAKKEILKVPVISTWMRSMGCVFLDRKDLRKSLETMNTVEEILKAGRSVVIFPEGTRSKGPDMGDFRAGALRCAIKAGVPIVPFALDGSYKAFEAQGYIKPAAVNFSILPPIETLGNDKVSTKLLGEQVKDAIQKELDSLRSN